MSEGVSREEVHEAVERAVMELLEAAGVREPPADPAAVARHLGLDLTRERGRPPRGGGVRKGAAGEGELTEEQRNRLAAQRIGAHQRGEVLRRLGLDPDQTRGLSGESLPNRFADALLVPARWLADEGRACGWDLLALGERFRTAGLETVALRLLDLPEPCIITILDNGQVHVRRSNACRPGRELSEPERRCQEYVHRYSRPYELAEAGWQVRGWPVHREDWKREILRSRTDEM